MTLVLCRSHALLHDDGKQKPDTVKKSHIQLCKEHALDCSVRMVGMVSCHCLATRDMSILRRLLQMIAFHVSSIILHPRAEWFRDLGCASGHPCCNCRERVKSLN
mmetsp:Transcript_9715/g.58945  ORF Transcript_9715/g.58945 Transcript_9715/m.58945 type:complete len:105 (-) Transcript_9715:5661-5975(-)